jgi:arylsulfatase A-like enzyme
MDQPEHESLYWEFTEKGGTQALRKGRWKLVRTNVITEPPGDIELFDLERDAGEMNDLAVSHPERVVELLELMEQSRMESQLFPLFDQSNE